jgi:putative transposase
MHMYLLRCSNGLCKSDWQELGLEVDHSTLNRWVLKYVPLLDKQFRACKRVVGSSWRMDET